MNALYTGSASLEYVNRKFMEDERVSRANKKALNWFLNECSAQGLGWQRLRKYAANFHTILALSDWKFDLKTATEKDIKELVVRINNAKYAESTRTDCRIAIRCLFNTAYPPSENRLRLRLSIGTDHLKNLIARLERMGLVRLERHGQKKTHVLTEEGMKVYESLRPSSLHPTSLPHQTRRTDDMVGEKESEGGGEA